MSHLHGNLVENGNNHEDFSKQREIKYSRLREIRTEYLQIGKICRKYLIIAVKITHKKLEKFTANIATKKKIAS